MRTILILYSQDRPNRPRPRGAARVVLLRRGEGRRRRVVLPRCRASSWPSSVRTARASRRCSGSCSGCCAPTPASSVCSGSIRTRSRIAARLGYVPQRRVLAPDLPVTVCEIVSTGRLARRGWWRRRTPERPRGGRPRDRVGRPRRALPPAGARALRRAAAARADRKALASDPELLVLDEPIAGVDAESQRLFRDSLVHLVVEHGAAVLLVSHELGAVADDLDRVLVMKRSIVFDGPPAELAGTGVSLGIHDDDLPLWLEAIDDRARAPLLDLPWPFEREYMQLALARRPRRRRRARRSSASSSCRSAWRSSATASVTSRSPASRPACCSRSGRCGPRCSSPSAVRWSSSGCAGAGRATGDLALALIFYGGIAAGVVLISRARRGERQHPPVPLRLDPHRRARRRPPRRRARHRDRRHASRSLGRALFAIVLDEEPARVAGLPVDCANSRSSPCSPRSPSSPRCGSSACSSSPRSMVLPVASSRLLARFVPRDRRWSRSPSASSRWSSGSSPPDSGPSPPAGSIVLVATACLRRHRRARPRPDRRRSDASRPPRTEG